MAGILKVDKSDGASGDVEIRLDRRHDGADAKIKVAAGASGAYGTELHFITQHATGPTENTVMVLDDNANVGIGTTSPTTALQVTGEISASSHITTDGEIKLLDGGQFGARINYNTTNNLLNIQANEVSGDDILMMANDKVMIGTSHVNDLLTIDTDSATARHVISGSSTSTGSFGAGYIDNKLGIGTTTPTYDLDINKSVSGGEITLRVVNSNTGANSSARLYLGAFGASGTGDPHIYFNDDVNDWALGVDKSDSSKFKLSDHSSIGTNDRLVIDTSGKVGIGTDSPDSTLHVHTATAGSWSPPAYGDDLVIENSADAGMSIVSPDGNSSYLVFSSPSRNAQYNALVYSSYGGGSEYLAMNTYQGGEVMRLTHQGRVGIGTTSPGTTLEVDGQAMVSGSGLWFKHATYAAGDLGFKVSGQAFQMGLFGEDGYIEFHTDDTLRWTMDDGGAFVGGGIIRTGTGTEASPAIQFASANDGFYHLASGDTGINVLVNNVQEALFRDGGDFHVDGDIIAYSTLTDSDYRLKTNIQNISSSLDKVKKLRPVEFDWLVDRDNHEYGLIAQEVEEVLPMLVSEHNALGDTKKFLKELDGTEVSKTVDYSKLTVLLVDAMKEQQEQINELKTEIQELKNGSSK